MLDLEYVSFAARTQHCVVTCELCSKQKQFDVFIAEDQILSEEEMAGKLEEQMNKSGWRVVSGGAHCPACVLDNTKRWEDEEVDRPQG